MVAIKKLISKICYKMESNELKEIDIKNPTCYYFDDLIKIEDFDVVNILIDERLHKRILVYDISYKTLFDSNSCGIRFDEIDGFIRVYDGMRYLVLFAPKIYDATYNRIGYLSQKK